MDETRDRAYQQLIHALLNCPNGEQSQILQDNSELLDRGFLQACESVAANLAEQGQENAASFLRNLASQVEEFLDTNDRGDSDNSESESPQDYVRFVRELLLAELDSKGDIKVIYPMLAQRQPLLNLRFAETLEQVAENLIAEYPEAVEYIVAFIEKLSIDISDFPRGNRAKNIEIAITGYKIVLNNRQPGTKKYVGTQNNLANAYSDRIKGSRADNLEKAIEFYLAALTVYKLEDFPEDWAMTQNNLAAAYKNRINGSRADNLERAIEFYLAALTVYTLENFPENWAMTQNNLAAAYSDRINGSRADNLERAIECSQAALTIRTPEDFPEDWATTQNNLAAAYLYRINGSRADNLERAIECSQAALTIRTFEDFPEKWAMTQNNLATAYSDRINGSRADNLEKAIECYLAALTVYTLEDFPEKWAITQNNLAIAYRSRINGSRANNLERAIEFYLAALTVRTPEDFPEDWAMTQNNLAAAYLYRINGSRANNLERAIEFYLAALTVYTLEDFPEDWAMTQNNLAAAYSDRINGSRADNLERAIECSQAALTVYTLEDFPEKWAMTQNNLATAYSDRIKGSRADNLEKAIEFYLAALTVYTLEDFPEKWAMTQNNLAADYNNRINGSRADNLERAIEFYLAALTVYILKDFPEQWAITQNNLAIAYRSRINGSRADNLERAIEFCLATLTIRTREAFPQEHTETLSNLGNLYQNNQQWQLAYDTYTPAIETVELLRNKIKFGDESKQKLAEEWNQLYLGMVEVCIELENYTEAIEYVERSKARNLVELFANRDIKPKGNIPETVLNELSRLSREIEAEQRRLEIEQINSNSNGGRILGERSLQIDSLTTSRDSTHLTKLRKQLDELIAREITPIDPDFSLTQKVKPILYKDIQTLTGENTAILEWYITGDKFLTFIITPQTPTPIIWQSSTANFEALVNWYDEYRKDYEESKPPERKPQWQEKLASRLHNLAEILQLDRILENIPKQCDRLILIPHRFLHLFPLHALPISHERDVERGYTDEQNSATTVSLSKSDLCFLDLFPGGVSYAPSCQLLQQAKQRQRPNFSHLFAIANPTKDRYLLELQAANICEKFKSNDFLAKDDANKNAILNAKLNFANCAHFGCHGKFEPDSPLESSLVFANKERLTLLEILNLDLNQCRLVTLSACETGLTKSKTSDEYIGLPFGFLLAGSPSIVSTLWEVDQVTSTLLLMRFYENLESMSTVTALNEAQQWLRNMTSEGLEVLLKDLKPQIDEIFDRLPLKERTRYVNAPLKGAQNRKPFPFVEPHYWSGFIAIGV
ncbi:MAG: tetratricopeptide repeat protein [Microcoleus sp. PH2017_25_DOB_D_A]|uniref:CHAT domain-containing protein n=1 Tax=unclassified Microcoleus TaxID=2642155 RepID=UPI001DAD94E7|nr:MULTISPECIES: CHAT domain-containing protein [unclassified Microcoleus]TAE12150.1 MAG: CHAT domain-containing protein [Oscillatoriales cyanobacterium]MCC3489319.1 tetratricopeptide repeat protein [Microcoleus sp. PH2017_16_JOR_D_A]MCC3533275.1 tetratricopeptide repeat protein [Microcoleus sp. PH2017_25_DOB_D_A]MCC3547434.1 tetratricopeptide repeat protein [Microcoleus sp. PH2017_24_DOB_U_A]TAE26300.1 MAG: CHAT domain-containing protein [Oscillatoriales cyanobacterium]